MATHTIARPLIAIENKLPSVSWVFFWPSVEVFCAILAFNLVSQGNCKQSHLTWSFVNQISEMRKFRLSPVLNCFSWL